MAKVHACHYLDFFQKNTYSYCKDYPVPLYIKSISWKYMFVESICIHESICLLICRLFPRKRVLFYRDCPVSLHIKYFLKIDERIYLSIVRLLSGKRLFLLLKLLRFSIYKKYFLKISQDEWPPLGIQWRAANDVETLSIKNFILFANYNFYLLLFLNYCFFYFIFKKIIISNCYIHKKCQFNLVVVH